MGGIRKRIGKDCRAKEERVARFYRLVNPILGGVVAAAACTSNAHVQWRGGGEEASMQCIRPRERDQTLKH